jgi:uncharacterized protein DUF998
MDRRELGAWAGMIGSALFVAIFTVEGLLRPGYDARSMFVSALSLGSRGWIQIVNFLVTGALFLLFAWGVAAEFREGKASKAGPIILAIIGLCLFFSGPFVMDPASTPRTEWSGHGITHQLLGAVVFTLAPVSTFVFLRRFRADTKWQPLQWWTLAVGIITVAAVVVLRVGPAQPPAPPTPFNAWSGLIQRALLVPYMAWIFTFAWRLHKVRQVGVSAQPQGTSLAAGR